MKPANSNETKVFPERFPFAARAAQTVAGASPTLQELALKALFVIILGAALGTSGPYGTYLSVPLPVRLGFWVTVLVIPWAVWETLILVARALLPKALGRRVLMALLMPAFAVVGSLFATSLSAVVFSLNSATFLEAWAQSLLSWLSFSFLVVLPMVLIADALSRREQHRGGENLLGFFSTKLPEHLRGSHLVALKSEGHYLCVYTTTGRALIHMSMDDALSALSAYPGIQTHRSWWVAIDQIDRGTGHHEFTETLPTLTGLNIPVSRRRRKTVLETLSHTVAAGPKSAASPP